MQAIGSSYVRWANHDAADQYLHENVQLVPSERWHEQLGVRTESLKHQSCTHGLPASWFWFMRFLLYGNLFLLISSKILLLDINAISKKSPNKIISFQ
jgi:hypothetical protein